jgi:hypothetical protein
MNPFGDIPLLPHFLNTIIMYSEEEITQYRDKILQALLAERDDKPVRVTEKEARKLLDELTDNELADGIAFNSPEEIADLLLEVR